MYNERRNNIPLVSRKDILRNAGLENEVKNIRYYGSVRKPRVDKTITNRVIALSMAATLALPLFGTAAYVNRVVNEVNAEKEYMSQPIYSNNEQDYVEGSTYDETRPFSPDNLVFDEVVYDVDNVSYRLVVNKQGDCSFVNMDYEAPFENLSEINCYDMAERMGFDFDSISKGQSR